MPQLHARDGNPHVPCENEFMFRAAARPPMTHTTCRKPIVRNSNQAEKPRKANATGTANFAVRTVLPPIKTACVNQDGPSSTLGFSMPIQFKSCQKPSFNPSQ